MPETWKPVVGYEDLYEVSDHGNVRSLDKKVPNRYSTRFIPGKLLKGTPNKDGYLYVSLYKNTQRTRFLIHRLVLETFVGSCPEGMECLHKDHNRSNNHLSNLDWDTHKNNVYASIERGTLFPNRNLTYTLNYA